MEHLTYRPGGARRLFVLGKMKSYFIRPLVWVITPRLFLTSVSERIQLGHISLINESLGAPVPLLWSGLCTCCNLPRLMEEGQPGSLSISTQRGEKWKQLICTDLNNLPPWKNRKYGARRKKEAIKESGRGLERCCTLHNNKPRCRRRLAQRQ